MQTRAAVAWKAGEPLSIETIEIEGPNLATDAALPGSTKCPDETSLMPPLI